MAADRLSHIRNMHHAPIHTDTRARQGTSSSYLTRPCMVTDPCDGCLQAYRLQVYIVLDLS